MSVIAQTESVLVVGAASRDCVVRVVTIQADSVLVPVITALIIEPILTDREDTGTSRLSGPRRAAG